ncbi:MAG: HdeD family acid-resistance protein [Candidatus Eremiobacteraeota bacterium]|nr:HdeD family acid-resistance protein [Candidatus Eremiobacteraeota bacterium]
MKTIAEDLAGSVQEAHKEWGWYLALGILLVVTGIFAIWSGTAATIASVMVLGGVLCIAGIAQLVSAFMARGAGHVILLLLVGMLDIVVGWMLVQHPDAGALTITLLLAALFVFGGIYRFVAALWLQFPQYGWVALSGLVSFLLGIMLWAQWPVSATWFIGFAVGVNFIFAGVAWSSIAFKLKTL